VWPSEEAVLPENLPTLPKNIAKKNSLKLSLKTEVTALFGRKAFV
jgi:hypothetical protein